MSVPRVPRVYSILGGDRPDCHPAAPARHPERLEVPMSLEDAFPQPRPFYPIKGWSDVPPDITAAEINGLVVRDFTPLSALKNLHALRAVCDTTRQLEAVGRLGGLQWLALDHCGAAGLGPVAGLADLRALHLFAFKAASLAGFES